MSSGKEEASRSYRGPLSTDKRVDLQTEVLSSQLSDLDPGMVVSVCVCVFLFASNFNGSYGSDSGTSVGTYESVLLRRSLNLMSVQMS